MNVPVATPLPLIPGSVVRCRPVGIPEMEYESGIDAKVLAVPIDKLPTLYHRVNCFHDPLEQLLDRVAHFFDHCKGLEPGRLANITGWKGPEEVKQEILASVDRYQQAAQKPAF